MNSANCAVNRANVTFEATVLDLDNVWNWASQVAVVVKNQPANAGDIKDMGLIPGLGRCPGGEHGNPLQYSCLENPMDKRSVVGYSPWDHKESERSIGLQSQTRLSE